MPCVAEAPQLEALARQGVEIDGVAIRDRTEDRASASSPRNGNPYQRIGADDLSQVQLAIGSSGVPETFVIDGKGMIRYQHIGDIRAEDVPMLIEKLARPGHDPLAARFSPRFSPPRRWLRRTCCRPRPMPTSSSTIRRRRPRRRS